MAARAILFATAILAAARSASGAPGATPNPAPVGAAIAFAADPVPGATYSWDFGDGSPATDADTLPTAVHRFASPGRYAVLLRTAGSGAPKSLSFYVLVHPPLPARRPAASAPIVVDGPRRRVYAVNPDHGTVACLDADKLERVWEAPSGKGPVSIAQGPDGILWIANRDEATLSLLDPATGARIAGVALPFASRPSALAFDPAGERLFVSLEAIGRVARIDPAARRVAATAPVAPHPRGLAIDPGGKRVLVAHFLSRGYTGLVSELDAATFAPARTIGLGEDPGPDAENAGRGSPNHLAAIAFEPDGSRAWIPAKKDNLRRGKARDGLALDFQSTVRAMVARVDPAAGKEVERLRLDFDDSEGPSAVAFGPWGFPAFLAFRGSEKVVAWDPFAEAPLTTLPGTGAAPIGMAVDSATGRLFVLAFLAREVAVYDAKDLTGGTGTPAPLIARIPTAAAEPLAADVLLGKRIFNKAADIRMGKDGYLSCASCHADGGSDGRVWDFTDRGEGLRSTVPLQGRARQGPLHWSANFDEMQDFEHDMRGPFGGVGFAPDADFHAGSRGKPLGDKLAGVSPELDALAAYVASLGQVPPSPWRNPDGTLTGAALRGKAIFRRPEVGCARCHSGPDLSDSRLAPVAPDPLPAGDTRTAEGFLLHDVGTLKPHSGGRLGAALPGLDTPGLKGLWETAPYLHDGSAATLEALLTEANPQDRHGKTSGLSAGEREDLIAYLMQLDDLDDEGRPAAQGGAGWKLSPAPLPGGGWRIRIRGAAPGLRFAISLHDVRGSRLGRDATATADGMGIAEWRATGREAPAFARACAQDACRSIRLPR